MSGRRGREPVLEPVDYAIAELRPDPDRPRGWMLLLDGTPQSHVDLDDPTHLEFDYVRRLGHVIDLVAPPRRPVRALHLGGGALTLARYVAATRPRSSQLVAEIDGALVALVRRELPLDRAWRLRVRTSDARAAVVGVRAGAFDLIVSDVFAGARSPAHLASVEFVHAVARALDAGGIYAVNVADGPPREFARGQVATVQAVFAHTCLIGDPAVLRGRRFGNFVVLAGRRELPVPELTRRIARDPMPGRVMHGPALARFTGGTRPVVDATAVASPLPPDAAFNAVD